MQRTDLERFQKLLVEVYECYGSRPPSAAALVHWADALHSYPFHNVETVLRNWLQTKPKAPVIADITRPCADILSDTVERRAEADKRQFEGTPDFQKATPFGKECIRAMLALVAKPKPPSKEWARRIMENPESTFFQRQIAKPVYATLQHREPGQDEEEYTAPVREAEEITI